MYKSEIENLDTIRQLQHDIYESIDYIEEYGHVTTAQNQCESIQLRSITVENLLREALDILNNFNQEICDNYDL